MNIEQRPQVIRTADIVGMIRTNASWVIGGKEQFNGVGRSPNDLLKPCIDYLTSLWPAEERDTARARYQTLIAEMPTQEDQLRFISGAILGEWQKNMP